MNKALITTISIFVAVPSLFADKIDCTKPADATFKSVTAKPETVLQVVSKDVAASPKCACPIVKAAISASQADLNLQGDIVAAAITAAPEEAASIKACIPPQAHGKGMGGKEPVSTGKGQTAEPKATGTNTAETGEPGTQTYDGWFDPLIYGAGGMGIAGGGGGTYTSSPGGGGGGGVIDNPNGIINIIEDDSKDGPRIVVRPGTRSK